MDAMQKGFSAVLVIFIAVAIGVAGYFLFVHQFCEAVADDFVVCTRGYISKALQKSEQSSSPVESSRMPSPTNQNGTKDWKTYRNEKYGFEVKYPAEWIAPTASPSNFDEKTKSFLFVNEGCLGHGVPNNEDDPLITSTESVMLDGKPWEKVIIRERDGSAIYMSWQMGTKDTSACLELVASPSSTNQVEILEKVLSTFKFIK